MFHNSYVFFSSPRHPFPCEEVREVAGVMPAASIALCMFSLDGVHFTNR